jgi:hypothetical protein
LTYSSTLSLTLALDGVGGQLHATAALPPGKETRDPLYRRLGGPQGRSGRLRKISPPTGTRSPGLPARIESLYKLRLCVCIYIHIHVCVLYCIVCFAYSEQKIELNINYDCASSTLQFTRNDFENSLIKIKTISKMKAKLRGKNKKDKIKKESKVIKYPNLDCSSIYLRSPA